ncbi:MAG: DUF4325 domain-containing protein [Patescibacteria group bacterium]|nr:DUF4325 domain-containing protein [Patescibacteria group bacterium]
MKIELKKFGNILTSRQLGKEAFAAFLPNLKTLPKNEIIEVDFDGVDIFSPSWGDEFLTQLDKMFPGKMFLNATSNPSVNITLEILESANSLKFLRK